MYPGRRRWLRSDVTRVGRPSAYRSLLRANDGEGLPARRRSVAAEQARPGPPPASLGEMIEAAEAVSAEGDSLRVDFCSVTGGAFFGELANDPDKGVSRFRPATLDALFGGYLELDDGPKPGPTVDYAVAIDENTAIPPAKTP